MSIPLTKQNFVQASITISPPTSIGHVEKYEKSIIMGLNQGQSSNGPPITTGIMSKKTMKQQLIAQSHGAKRKYSHSKHAVDRESSEDKETEEPATVVQQQQIFRTRSKTISDTSGNDKQCWLDVLIRSNI